VLAAAFLLRVISPSPAGIGLPSELRVTIPTMLVGLAVAALVGVLSALLPSYQAARKNIVEALRHIG
jgi:ABC-type antimicrobial peptide transport system permease subunit